MKIAIVGAGFSGIATAWNLLQHPKITLTLFDGKGVGGGASGMAAGLLHPYVGAHAKKNWMANEGLQATTALLQISAKSLNTPVSESVGMLRIALTEQQRHDFHYCASINPDVEWFDETRCQQISPHNSPHPGIFIHSAIAVHASLYLKGLWKACEARGGMFNLLSIQSLHDLKEFDAIVLTVGADIGRFPELKDIRITPVKGQILELAWPQHTPPLRYPINSQAYVLMSYDRTSCIAGTTFERDFRTSEPDLPFAKDQILSKISSLLPCLEGAEILACKAGIRASTPDRKPLIAEPLKNTWLLTGMGSKGLLYHAVYARKLAEIILGRFFGEERGLQQQN
jgi:glycine/D-amino acid oxidase-like deaminating enzyme